MKTLVVTFSACAAVLVATASLAAPTDRYPNLASAQRAIDQSYASIDAAQQFNHGGFEGHAEKAKQLLREAKAQLEEAAIARDRHR